MVYESTVYPGATEEACVPVLERHCGLRSGRDFFVGWALHAVEHDHLAVAPSTRISDVAVGVEQNLRNAAISR